MQKIKINLPRRIKKRQTGYRDAKNWPIFIGDRVHVCLNNGYDFFGTVYRSRGEVKITSDLKTLEGLQITRIAVILHRSQVNNRARYHIKYCEDQNKMVVYRKQEEILEPEVETIPNDEIGLRRRPANKFAAFDEFIQDCVKAGNGFEVRLNFSGTDLADWATRNY
jgi:hypothetical protein